MPALLRELGCLPLAEREIRLGSVRDGLMPLAHAGGGDGARRHSARAGGGRLLRRRGARWCCSGSLPLREAYEAIEWPILVMLGALIPVSEALRTTGGTDVIAGWLVDARARAARPTERWR